MMIPLPFSRMVFAVGEPVYPSGKNLDSLKSEVSESLNNITSLTDTMCNVKTDYSHAV